MGILAGIQCAYCTHVALSDIEMEVHKETEHSKEAEVARGLSKKRH